MAFNFNDNPDLEKAMLAIRKLPKWGHSPEEIAKIKSEGNITEAAKWDCARPDQRAIMRPDLNPNKRWFEQKAWEKFDKKS